MRRNTCAGNGIIEALAGIRDRLTMRRFIAEVLTPAERRNLTLRWQLMRMLAAGMPQRAIAARLGISLCKITRGSAILRQHSSVSRRILREYTSPLT